MKPWLSKLLEFPRFERTKQNRHYRLARRYRRRVERLEVRWVLSDFGITVFEDVTLDGLTFDDPPAAGWQLALHEATTTNRYYPTIQIDPNTGEEFVNPCGGVETNSTETVRVVPNGTSIATSFEAYSHCSYTEIIDGEPITKFRPSVQVFRSLNPLPPPGEFWKESAAETVGDCRFDCEQRWSAFHLPLVQGSVFEDLDGNGRRDREDPPVSDALVQSGSGTVVLFRETAADTENIGVSIQSDRSDAGGNFEFAALKGDLTIRVAAIGDEFTNIATTGGVYLSGEAESGAVFDREIGLFYRRELSGQVYHDHDGNSVRDEGDEAFTAFPVTIAPDGNGDGEHSAHVDDCPVHSCTPNESIVEVDEFGIYQAMGPGLFGPVNFLVSLENEPLFTVTEGGGGHRAFSGVEKHNADIGIFLNVPILGGQVFEDRDGSGELDSHDDRLLAGQTVQLDLNDDGTIDETATTGQFGEYNFLNVGPGTHRISQVLPPGFQQTKPCNGDGGYVLTMESGEPIDRLDFGRIQAEQTRACDDIRLLGFGSADELGANLIIVGYELRGGSDGPEIEDLDPFDIRFYESGDGRLDTTGPSVDKQLAFQINVSPEGLAVPGVQLLDATANPQSSSLALRPGRHILLIDPVTAGAASLRQALENPEVETILAVADATLQIPESDTHPLDEDNTLTFRGTFQHELDPANRAVVRTGVGYLDIVYVEQSSDPETPAAIRLEIDEYSSVTLVGASDILVVTSDETDFIKVGSDFTRTVIAKAGGGDDIIIGGPRNDTLDGAAGSDVILGEGYGPDLSPPELKDFLSGLFSKKLLLGGARYTMVGSGNDTLLGGAGFDVLLGGPGDDLLDGGDGGSILFGDGFVANASNLTVDFGAAFSSPDNNDAKAKSLFQRALSIVKADVSLFNLNNPSDGNDEVRGGTGLDLIFGNGGNDNLYGGGGIADVLISNNGSFSNATAEIDDRLYTDARSFTDSRGVSQTQAATTFAILLGGDGNDELAAGISGSIVASLVTGNILIGAEGNDTLNGGDSNDLLVGDTFDFDGPTISSFVDFISNLFDAKIKATIELKAVTAEKGAGKDTINGKGGLFDFILGGDGDDSIDAGTGNSLVLGDSFDVKAGLDIDFGGAKPNGTDQDNTKGNRFAGAIETFFKQFLPNVTLAGEGKDKIKGASDAFDLIIAGNGDDKVDSGGGFVDVIFGNEGVDELNGSTTGLLLMVGGEDDDTLDATGAFNPSATDGILRPFQIAMLVGDTFKLLTPDFGFLTQVAPYPILGNVLKVPYGFGIQGGFIQDGDGKDTIRGSTRFLSGNILVGGSGDDTITGGGRIDLIFGDSFNVGLDLKLDMTKLNPQAFLTGSKTFADVLSAFEELELPVLAGSGKDTINGANTTGLTIAIGGNSDDTITGGEGGGLADFSSSMGRFDILFGDGGHDKIIGQNGFNVLVGGDANDELDRRQ